MVNFGERFGAGERISTGFVESAVNQIIDKRFNQRQSMRWTPKGAHLLLQTRTHVLNGDLDELLRRRYPDFRTSSKTEIAPVWDRLQSRPEFSLRFFYCGASFDGGPALPEKFNSPT